MFYKASSHTNMETLPLHPPTPDFANLHRWRELEAAASHQLISGLQISRREDQSGRITSCSTENLLQNKKPIKYSVCSVAEL